MQEGPMDDDDLIEILAINQNKDFNIDKYKDKGQVLTANLIREGLKHAISLEQHFRAHDPDIDRMLQFQRKLKSCVAGY